MFRSSFSSCTSKNTDVIEKPDNENQNHKQNHSRQQQLIELFSPNFRSNICRPRCSESSFHEECIVNKNNNMLTRISRKADTTSSSFLSERKSLLPPPSDNFLLEGQKCPPASPASPYDHSKHKPKPKPKPKRNTTNKKKRKKSTKRRVSKHQFSGDFHAFPTNFNYNGLFSSGTDTEEEDDDKTTLFSSTTDSSSSFRRGRNTIAAAGVDKKNRRAAALIYDDDVYDNGDDVKVKDSFAVVKRSRDPYSDFRTSMVEMIIEKQIFSGEDLENLLRCFLSLNSYHHHKVIIRVFTDIWEALFL